MTRRQGQRRAELPRKPVSASKQALLMAAARARPRWLSSRPLWPRTCCSCGLDAMMLSSTPGVDMRLLIMSSIAGLLAILQAAVEGGRRRVSVRRPRCKGMPVARPDCAASSVVHPGLQRAASHIKHQASRRAMQRAPAASWPTARLGPVQACRPGRPGRQGPLRRCRWLRRLRRGWAEGGWGHRLWATAWQACAAYAAHRLKSCSRATPRAQAC